MDVKKPKKGLYGGLSFKKPSLKEKVEVPKLDVAVPEGENMVMPSVTGDVWVEIPEVPSVDVKKPKKGLYGGLSFKKPSLTEKLEAPKVDVAVPDEGENMVMPSVTGDVSVEIPEVPSVDVKKPKKALYGGLSFKKPSLTEKVEVPKVDAAVPEADNMVMPSVTGDVSVEIPEVPSVDVKKPKKGLYGGLFFKKPS